MSGQIVHQPRRVRSEPGSPSKRTPEREALIIECLENGLTRTAACGAAGITLSTLNNWTDGDDELADRLEVALAKGEAVLLGRIIDAGENPRNWVANAWVLERTRQKTYALRAKVAQDEGTTALSHALAEEIRRRLNEPQPSVTISSPEPAFVEAESRVVED